MQGSHTSPIPAARQRIIERIAAYAVRRHKRVGKIAVSALIAAYYRGVAVEDLRTREISDLAGAALAHFKFAQQRKRGTPLVRIYSPEVKRDGFSSTHSIVEVTMDDMPFLVDSLNLIFAKQGLDVHLTIHPVLRVQRDRQGIISALLVASEEAAGTNESWQHIEIDRLADAADVAKLHTELVNVLRDVQRTHNDRPKMLDQVHTAVRELRTAATKQHNDMFAEGAALMEWLMDSHFTFLGYREFRLRRGADSDQLEPLPETSLGILRTRHAPHTVELTGKLRAQARAPEPIFVTKANAVSTVHRSTYLDYIGIKLFDAKQQVIGERRFLGLFATSVYQSSPREVPVLRAKLAQLIQRFGLVEDSHDGKSVMRVLDSYPRDELFQASIDELLESIRGIVNVYERNQVRLFMRRDRFHRYYASLLFIPRDRYNTQIRRRVEAIMLEALHGTAVESQVQLSDSALARLQVLVRSRPDEQAAIATEQLELRIAEAVRTWSDRLRAALIAKHGEPRGLSLARQYASLFPAAYQDDTAIEDAVADIAQMAPLLSGGDGIALRLQRLDEQWHLRLLRSGVPMLLSDALPVLENLGLRVLTERPYRITSGNERAVWIQDFELEALSHTKTGMPLNDLFGEAFLAINNGHAENDGFNRLVLAAGLAWRPVSVLRTYARYLLQTGLPFSQVYMQRTLSMHASIATELWNLFAAKFDPELATNVRRKTIDTIQRRILKQLDGVQAQDDDRILRAYLTVIAATLRTNYYQTDASGQSKSYLSIKIDSQRIPELPLPKPHVEIFVCSPSVEGIHLRMGKVARGGLRWSDRREDFRTEVLGLMKAQNVKNTVIVPVGAKGGFIPKHLAPSMSNDDRQREGIASYRTFIRGLLDLTDNTVRGKIVPPEQVVRHDADDPYLVVAADKGTASFSDIANSVAAEYNLWLGDAFASGGSVGYDHKKMAITARGAWECVKRHFREIDLDTQSQDFTVVGVGDMSGDVFGNGMLRSKHIRLLAAFDHRHIFIDPNPDSAVSFAERERLFALPRSSWADYNAKAISTGGGVFARSVKAIKLTPQLRAMLGIGDNSLTPQALIRALLCLPVDLLWNGGIGTYVKASNESHLQVGDRANDSVRVDGKDLRCKVVGEGGNLGCTQLGRVEYALHGGRINTDFIDNSAGVDCSDHEVNIKILLNAAGEKGLKLAERNKLLVRMTNDVGALVLRDNYLQSQALSMMEFSAKERLPEHAHFIRSLEITNELDRTVEFLPSAEDIAERGKQGAGLSRPELAVLLSYSKIALFNRLIGTDVPEDPYLSQELERYFPPVLRERYRPLMRTHRLRREIITTAVTNSLVNRMGASFALRAQEDTGADAAAVARAYTIARECIEARELWGQIEGLDNKVPAATQYSLMNNIARLLRFVTFWHVNRHRNALRIETRVAALRPGIRELRKDFKAVLTGGTLNDYHEQHRRLISEHIPAKLAEQLAGIEALYSAPDIVEVAAEANRSVTHVARVYFALDALLSINWLRDQVQSLDVKDRWQAVARNTLRDNLYALHRTICLQALASGKDDALAAWQLSRAASAQHAVDSLKEMRALPKPDFATLSVAVQAIRKLT